MQLNEERNYLVGDLASIIVSYLAHPMVNVIDTKGHTALDYVINNPHHKLTCKVLLDYGGIAYKPIPYNSSQENNSDLNNPSTCPDCLELIPGQSYVLGFGLIAFIGFYIGGITIKSSVPKRKRIIFM